jgi:ketosteroid isomerase-like protein
MSLPGAEDLRRLSALRDGFARAESGGDASFFESVLAEDAVILPPWRAACEGKSACLELIREVLSDVAREFDRVVVLTSAEVQVNGDWALDRGRFSQRLVRKEGGEELHEAGKYFWLYRREEGSWKLARLVGNYDGEGEGEADQGRIAPAP